MNSGHDVSLAITCFAGRPANCPHENCEWLELQLKSQKPDVNAPHWNIPQELACGLNRRMRESDAV